MLILTVITSVVAVVSLSHGIYQRREMKQLTNILYAVADDVQEVRNVTHGKPRVSFLDN